ncbi:hypothetical protein AMATHDRAFT_55207 [Amanita thiersii Skay4041]|uniref:Uncharacterized protein n=1 Tax=Amanita thiersii Skay4041 TaxID=703135 RepID=A0A2A9NTA5_9AGAR|nr:hypothetical protein AMATHDRAFT_55207 [Amanita thiersii Skay4041]
MTTSPLAGWHARGLAHLYPNPHSFEPRRDALKFALLRNNPVEPEGFSLAVFERGHDSAYVVVDALGRVMLLPSSSSDVNGLLALGRQTVDLPSTGEFRNTWFIAQPTTSQSIDRFLFVSPGAQDGVVETSVSGYSSTLTELRDPVNGYTRLPGVLQELFGVLLEARVGYQERRGGGDGDQTVLRKVRRALDDLL